MIHVPRGTVGFDHDSKKRVAAKYRFNADTEVQVVDRHSHGCGEFAHLRLIVLVDGKRISIRKP